MPADFEFPREKVLRLTEQQGGVTSEGQLVNSIERLNSDLFTHVFTRASFHPAARRLTLAFRRLVLREQIAHITPDSFGRR